MCYNIGKLIILKDIKMTTTNYQTQFHVLTSRDDNIMLKIKSESTLSTNSNVTIFVTECGREIYCSKWNGEQYNECWEYPNNENWQKTIDLDPVRIIYSEVENEDGIFEIIGINL